MVILGGWGAFGPVSVPKSVPQEIAIRYRETPDLQMSCLLVEIGAKIVPNYKQDMFPIRLRPFQTFRSTCELFLAKESSIDQNHREI